jgi:hypothetical protein
MGLTRSESAARCRAPSIQPRWQGYSRCRCCQSRPPYCRPSRWRRRACGLDLAQPKAGVPAVPDRSPRLLGWRTEQSAPMSRLPGAPAASNLSTRLRGLARSESQAVHRIEPAARPSGASAAPPDRRRRRPRTPEVDPRRAELRPQQAPDRSPTPASRARSRGRPWPKPMPADRSDLPALARARAQAGGRADRLSQPFLNLGGRRARQPG